MRRLIAMIAAAMAVARTVVVKCLETGRWIVKSILPSAAATPDLVDDFVPESPKVDDTLDVTRRVAAAMAEGRMPALTDLAAVHPSHLQWIREMEPSMRRLVAGSTDDALRAHIRGQKTIRGLLPADAESVAEYAAARRRRRNDEDVDDDEALPQPVYG